MEEFKRSNELQEYLLSYDVGSYDMAYEDFRKSKDVAIELAVTNFKAAMEEFQRSNEVQEYLLSQDVGSYNMAYKYFCRFLFIVQPTWYLSFIDTIKGMFHEGEGLDNIITARKTNALKITSENSARLPNETTLPPLSSKNLDENVNALDLPIDPIALIIDN